MLTPAADRKGPVDRGVTNIRNTSLSHWLRWLKPEFRCLVLAMSFCEPTDAGEPGDRSEGLELVRARREAPAPRRRRYLVHLLPDDRIERRGQASAFEGDTRDPHQARGMRRLAQTNQVEPLKRCRRAAISSF